MSKEILVLEDRVLHFKNVLSLTINAKTLTKESNLDVKMKLFDDYIKNNGLTGYGPLVIETNIRGIDEPEILITFIKKIKETNFKAIPPYEVLEDFKTENCLYSKFEGNENDSDVASLKMKVYAYEHDLVLDTRSYAVYLSKENDNVKIDTFIPLIGRLN